MNLHVTNASHGLNEMSGLEVYEFPCSTSQLRFWLMDQIHPGDPSCNVAVRWQLRGKLNPSFIEDAFNAIASRQDSLRTSFHLVDGEPVQRVWPAVSITMSLVDLRAFSESQRESECERQTVEFGSKPFDLTSPPLLRLLLLQLGDEDHILIVAAHHSIVDGWSMGNIAREMAEYYTARHQGQQPEISELPIQYADYAVWERDQVANGLLDSQRSYWEAKLKGYAPLHIPTDFAPGTQPSGSQIIARILPRALTDALRERANQEGVTLFAMVLAIFKVLTHQASGVTDVAVGSQCSGRNQVELEELVGCFINTIVLRTKISEDLTFLEFLQRVSDTVTEGLANQSMPFDQVVQMLHPNRDPRRNPLFSVNFIFQRAFVQNNQFAELTLTNLPARSPGAMYDLNFFMVERSEGWYCSCEYDTSLFRKGTVERMLENFQRLMNAVVDNPMQLISVLGSTIGATAVQEQNAVMEVAKANTPSGEPQTETERKLVAFWQELLGLQKVSTTANFFDLGGHSLLGVKLLARINKEFESRLTLERIFLSPTIQRLAAVIDGATEQNYPDGILPIQEKGRLAPFFCVNGWSEMRQLALGIGEDHPYLGLKIPLREQLTTPYTVSEIAKLQIREMRKFQRQGPYFIGGWCRGGIIAYEIAQQLRAQGEDVGLLIMFESTSPSFWLSMSQEKRGRVLRSLEIWRLKTHIKQLMRQNPGNMVAYAWDRAKNFLDRLKRRVRFWNYRTPASAHFSYDKDQIMDFATTAYVPKYYEGKAVLFRADEYKTWKYWDPSYGFSNDIRDLTVVEVPGRHESAAFFKSQQAETTGRKIRDLMEEILNSSTVGLMLITFAGSSVMQCMF